MNILFVCTGNTLRSAMAHYFFQNYDAKHRKLFHVSSAGTRGNPLGPYQETVELMQSKGIDMSAHRDTRLTQELVDAQDIIICMAKHHQEFIQEHFKTSSLLFNKVAIGESTDIQDDDEAQIWPGDPRFPAFLTRLCETIEKRIPLLYEKLTQGI